MIVLSLWFYKLKKANKFSKESLDKNWSQEHIIFDGELAAVLKSYFGEPCCSAVSLRSVDSVRYCPGVSGLLDVTNTLRLKSHPEPPQPISPLSCGQRSESAFWLLTSLARETHKELFRIKPQPSGIIIRSHQTVRFHFLLLVWSQNCESIPSALFEYSLLTVCWYMCPVKSRWRKRQTAEQSDSTRSRKPSEVLSNVVSAWIGHRYVLSKLCAHPEISPEVVCRFYKSQTKNRNVYAKRSRWYVPCSPLLDFGELWKH